jgi:hypothetical protein
MSESSKEVRILVLKFTSKLLEIMVQVCITSCYSIPFKYYGFFAFLSLLALNLLRGQNSTKDLTFVRAMIEKDFILMPRIYIILVIFFIHQI